MPGTDMTTLGRWAAEAERSGFDSLGVIDRLVYDNLDPLTALAAAASATSRAELITTVLNVGWRGNPVLLAKQMASVDLLSGGRLVAGMGLGGWPDDYTASDVPQSGGGATWDKTLSTMRRAWSGELAGQGGPMPALPSGRPVLLFGGMVPAAHRRAATHGTGWVAPLFGLPVLREGAQAVRKQWAEIGREGQPRIATGRYVSLGHDAERVADDYIHHYYGQAFFAAARADTLTSPARIRQEIQALREAGATDVVFYTASGDLEQIALLAEAIARA